MIDEAKIHTHILSMRTYAQGILNEADRIEKLLKPNVKVSTKKEKLNNIVAEALQKRKNQLIKQQLKAA